MFPSFTVRSVADSNCQIAITLLIDATTPIQINSKENAPLKIHSEIL